MDVSRHNDIFEDLPIAALVAVIDSTRYHFGDVVPREVWVPLGAVEPKFHLGEDSALEA